MRKVILVIVLLTSIGSSAVWAGDYEDGTAAYNRTDYATALQKFRIGAAKKDSLSQYNLGVMYDKGQGVPQDYVRAHLWSNLSAVSGDANSIKLRDMIASLMTPQQIAEAQKIARDCQAQNFKGCN